MAPDIFLILVWNLVGTEGSHSPETSARNARCLLISIAEFAKGASRLQKGSVHWAPTLTFKSTVKMIVSVFVLFLLSLEGHVGICSSRRLRYKS